MLSKDQFYDYWQKYNTAPERFEREWRDYRINYFAGQFVSSAGGTFITALVKGNSAPVDVIEASLSGFSETVIATSRSLVISLEELETHDSSPASPAEQKSPLGEGV